MDSLTPSVFDNNSGLTTSNGSVLDVSGTLVTSLELSNFSGAYPSNMLSENYLMGSEGYQSIDDKTLTETSAEVEFDMTDPSQSECEYPENALDAITTQSNLGFLLLARYPSANPLTIVSAVNRAVEIVEEQQARQMTLIPTASNNETEFQRQALIELPTMLNGVCNDTEVPSYTGLNHYYSNTNDWEGTGSAQAAIHVIRNALPARSDTGSEGSLDDMTSYWNEPI